MERQLVLETPDATLWYYPGHGIVHHEMHRHVHGQAFRDLLLRGAEVLRQHRATKWLSDDRKNAPLSRADGLWSQEEWLLPAIEAGWRCWAMVPPQTPAGERNIRVFTDTVAALGLRVKLFADPAEALAWLAAE